MQATMFEVASNEYSIGDSVVVILLDDTEVSGIVTDKRMMVEYTYEVTGLDGLVVGLFLSKEMGVK